MVMTAAVVQGEESVAAPVGGYAYIPDKPASAEEVKQKQSSRAQSKGRWVNVPPGMTPDQFAKKMSQLKEKMDADAESARRAAEKKVKSKKALQRASKRREEIQKQRVYVRAGLKKMRAQLASAKKDAAGTSDDKTFTQYLGMQEQAKAKIAKLLKLRAKSNKEEKAIDKSLKRREHEEQVLAMKAQKKLVAAQLMNIKEKFKTAAPGVKGSAKLVRYFTSKAEKDAGEIKKVALKEAKFTAKEEQAAKAEAEERALVKKLADQANSAAIERRITALKAAITKTRQQLDKVQAKEVNAKSDADSASETNAAAELKKGKAVSSLKSEFVSVNQHNSKANAAAVAAKSKLAKASVALDTDQKTLTKDEGELRASQRHLSEAEKDVAKEIAAKQHLAKAQAQSKLLVKQKQVAEVKAKHLMEYTQVKKSFSDAAKFASKEADAKKKASFDPAAKKKAKRVIKSAKTENVQTKKSLKASHKAVFKAENKTATIGANEQQAKGKITKWSGPSKEKPPVVAAQKTVEKSQKAVKKMTAEVEQDKVHKQLASEAKTEADTNAANAKTAGQSQRTAAIDSARAVRKNAHIDAINSAAAKKTVAAANTGKEQVAKSLMSLQTKLGLAKKALRRSKSVELGNKKEKAAKKEQKLRRKVARELAKRKLEEARKAAAAEVARVAKLALQKAAEKEKDDASKVAAKEKSVKSELTVKKVAQAKVEKRTKADQMAAKEKLTKKEDAARKIAEEKAAALKAETIKKAKALALVAEERGIKKKAIDDKAAEAKKAKDIAAAKIRLKTRDAALQKVQKYELQARKTVAAAQNGVKVSDKAALGAKHKAKEAVKVEEQAKKDLQDVKIKVQKRKKTVQKDKKKELKVLKKLTAFKQAVKDDKKLLKSAWTKKDKRNIEGSIRIAKNGVLKVEEEVDAVKKKVAVAKAARSSSKLSEVTAVEQLKTKREAEKKTIVKMKKREIKDEKTAAEAKKRGAKAKAVLKKIRVNVQGLKKQVESDQRLVKSAKKSLMAAKKTAESDCNKDKGLAKEAAKDKQAAAKIKQATKLKVDVEKTKEKSEKAKQDKTVELATKKKEAGSVAKLKNDEKAAVKTQAEIKGLKKAFKKEKVKAGKGKTSGIAAALAADKEKQKNS